MLQSEFILTELCVGPTTRALSPSVYLGLGLSDKALWQKNGLYRKVAGPVSSPPRWKWQSQRPQSEPSRLDPLGMDRDSVGHFTN